MGVSSGYIGELITPTIESMGFNVVRILFCKSRNLTLQIMVESMLDSQITVEDCAVISRSVSTILNIEDPISGEYVLEVSSPGLERPLTKLEDFDRFVGCRVKIELLNPIDGKKNFKGILRGTLDENILMEVNSKTNLVYLPFSEVSGANLKETDISSEFKKGQNNL